MLYPLIISLEPIKEIRIGLDGKYDFGPGLWFETVIIHQDEDVPILPYTYRHSLTLGADYTFEIGNGLHIMGEHLWFELADAFLMTGDGYQYSAFSMNYPIGLLDQLTTIFYYDWETESFYRFVNIQRIYDRWSIYLMAFWNPDQFNLPQMQQSHAFFAGKGIQFMIVFNH